MEEKIELNIDNSDLEDVVKDDKKMSLKDQKSKKMWLVFLIVGIVSLVGGIACLLVVFLKPVEERKALVFPTIPSKVEAEKTYSHLTGEAINADLVNSPAYCIQVPNGLDGARPQVGLTEAGVIFEAIAEAGITRFAAIFQNPTSAVIGPVRSLRIYYLNWDTPFDCTIVHAGGSAEAENAVKSGSYRNLTESYAYMYRGSNSSRLWNNLFTTPNGLAQFNADYGYTTSEINGFSHLTPEEAEKTRIDGMIEEKLNIVEATEKNTSELTPEVSDISLRFGYVAAFNVNYHYDVDSNTYLRSFGDGAVHEVYKCPTESLGEVDPESACSLTQLAPKAVVAMVVQEGRAADGYYENITMIGSGDVYIFQNGKVTTGTWSKASIGEQIKFTDSKGDEIKLVPGQTIVSAVPNYGGVDY